MADAGCSRSSPGPSKFADYDANSLGRVSSHFCNHPSCLSAPYHECGVCACVPNANDYLFGDILLFANISDEDIFGLPLTYDEPQKTKAEVTAKPQQRFIAPLSDNDVVKARQQAIPKRTELAVSECGMNRLKASWTMVCKFNHWC